MALGEFFDLSRGELAVRTRPVLLAAAAAAAGLAVLGTVAAQPPSGGAGQPRISSGPGGTLPATTVRPYSDWNSNQPPPGYVPRQPTGVQPAGYQPPGNYPQPPGGYPQPTGGYHPPSGGYQPPPGYRPVGGTGGNRLTQPVQAGPDGVRPAGGTEIPRPNLDVPTFRPGPAPSPVPVVPPTAGGPSIPPPNIQVDPPAESKFPALPVPPTGPANLPANTGPVNPPPAANPPVNPTLPNLPVPNANPNPNPLPVVNSTGPSVSPVGPNPPAALGPKTPDVPSLPGGNGPAVAGPPANTAVATPSAAMLPAKIAPCVQIEAIGPDTVAFGQDYAYKIVVRNAGQAAVSQLRVDDELPSGTRFVASDPMAEQTGDRLVWLLGGLDAGAERVIQVRVKPTEEGEFRSRATVSFAAAIDARTKVTRPHLVVDVVGSETCRAGEETAFTIKVRNKGSGPASKMVLQARLSDGLLHTQGTVIEAELANLAPDETRTVPLKVNAARAGLQACEIVVMTEGSPDAKARAAVNVVEPMLVVKQAGPTKCLVRAEPTYMIELSNPGTAITDPVQVFTVLPDGFEYVSASDGGTLNGRTVTWRVGSLPAGSTRSVTLKLRAVAAADGQLRTLAQTGPAQPAGGTQPAGGLAVRAATRGLEAKAEMPVMAEGVAAVRFEVIDVEDPVEVGKEALYEIRVTNQGTGPCTNIQLAAVLAEGTELVAVTGGPNQQQPGARSQGQGLVFEPIATLGVKSEVVYKVRVRGLAAGDHRFRVQLTCEQLRTPVIKEESTRFYKE